MTPPPEIIAPYLSSLILRHFSDHPGPLGEAMTQVEAAVLFTDISGFTPLAEALARRGREGSEELGRLLNAYYEPLIEEIAEHGGDIAKMAGDALVAVWAVEDGESLATATLRAAQCGLAVQAKMQGHDLGEGVRLAIKAGVSCGLLRTLHVGGVLDRWELLLAGAPLVEMADAEKRARPGDVVLSPGAWRLVRSDCRSEVSADGFARLSAITRPPPRVALVMPEVVAESVPSLWGYLAGAIRTRLVAGQAGWLSEMRSVTVLFVHLPGLDAHEDALLGRAQEVMRSLQGAIYSHEGSVNKLSVDDKGITLVAAFGLPPLAHGDDPARGVLAGLAIRDALARIGERCEVGITTGRAYCGEVGARRRREYTLIGDVVNLSARLMQAAVHHGGLLCDRATASAARARLEFEALAPISVKGKTDPIPVFRPSGLNLSTVGHRPLFGREAEQIEIGLALERVSGGRGGLLVIEGDAGLGKSGLILELLGRAARLAVPVYVGSGDPIESNTPYFAWRPILSSLLGIHDVADLAARQGLVKSRFAARAEIQERLSLLSDVLGLDLPATSVTEWMSGEVRADNTRELLLKIIGETAGSAPIVLVLDDAHWLDATSWSLTADIVTRLARVLMVVTTRPRADWPGVASGLIEDPATIRLRLDPLTPSALLALVRHCLGVSELPSVVATIIESRAEGNPLFAEELALSLRDAGLIVIEGTMCRLAPNFDAEGISFPDSMRGAILGRIDRLDPSQQLTLKSASVIGRLFQARVLRMIHPIEADRPHVGNHLSALVRLEFTLPDPATQDDAHAFKHVLTREVAYDLMLREQRRALHREVALWYEGEGGADLGPSYPLLAHHWQRAEDIPKAVEYLDLAGERALRGGSYREAADFFSRGRTLNPQSARREQALGECYLALGDLAGSRLHTSHALKLLGRPVPRNRAVQAASLTIQVGKQLLRRLRPVPLRPRGQDARSSADLQASAADAIIGQLCYFDHDLLLGVHSALRSLNLAETEGASPELARAYATASIAASLVPLFAASDYYARRAIETSGLLDDPQAKAWVWELVGITDLNACRWEQARIHLEGAMEIADRIHDWRRWSEAVGELARLEFHRGGFSRGRDLFASQYEWACRNGHEQARTWGLHGQALCCLRMGRDAEAWALLEQSPAISGHSASVTDAVLGGGLIATTYLRLGDAESARRKALTTVSKIGSSPPMVGYSLDGYAGAAQVLLDLASHDRHRSAELTRCAADACALLRRFARVFPIARPRSGLLSGRELWARGKRWQALRVWRKAAGIAESLGLPYECALLYAEIGSKSSDGATNDRERARELFTRLGARYELDRLGGESPSNCV